MQAPDLSPNQLSNGYEKATFAGGCFWCVEPPFDKLKGVISTTSGYTGGTTVKPTYEDVCSGRTGHAEAVEIVYDPQLVSYQHLLEVFWKNIDPTVKDKQFCDVGSQYRTEIFYHNEEQRKLAEAFRQKLLDSGKFKKIETKISPAGIFYPAEDYHQEYYLKNPVQYKFYHYACGRQNRLDELWGEKKDS